MSDFNVSLPESLQWFRRPPIWWDPVPDWLQLREDVRTQLFTTELRAQLEMMVIQTKALQAKIDLIEKGVG